MTRTSSCCRTRAPEEEGDIRVEDVEEGDIIVEEDVEKIQKEVEKRDSCSSTTKHTCISKKDALLNKIESLAQQMQLMVAELGNLKLEVTNEFAAE